MVPTPAPVPVRDTRMFHAIGCPRRKKKFSISAV